MSAETGFGMILTPCITGTMAVLEELGQEPRAVDMGKLPAGTVILFGDSEHMLFPEKGKAMWFDRMGAKWTTDVLVEDLRESMYEGFPVVHMGKGDGVCDD